MGRWGHAAKRRVTFIPTGKDPKRTLSPDEEERPEEENPRRPEGIGDLSI